MSSSLKNSSFQDARPLSSTLARVHPSQSSQSSQESIADEPQMQFGQFSESDQEDETRPRKQVPSLPPPSQEEYEEEESVSMEPIEETPPDPSPAYINSVEESEQRDEEEESTSSSLPIASTVGKFGSLLSRLRAVCSDPSLAAFRSAINLQTSITFNAVEYSLTGLKWECISSSTFKNCNSLDLCTESTCTSFQLITAQCTSSGKKQIKFHFIMKESEYQRLCGTSSLRKFQVDTKIPGLVFIQPNQQLLSTIHSPQAITTQIALITNPKCIKSLT
jgi:hypothetical protein